MRPAMEVALAEERHLLEGLLGGALYVVDTDAMTEQTIKMMVLAVGHQILPLPGEIEIDIK